ncbi:hypothetical protein RIF29_10715 [Crotalaria pallida]|uniref:Uncharacterized protein n=1 Tax=Crotalaria pallida TaxID=3830 RepID=A0AAN9IK00_CROPI
MAIRDCYAARKNDNSSYKVLYYMSEALSQLAKKNREANSTATSRSDKGDSDCDEELELDFETSMSGDEGHDVLHDNCLVVEIISKHPEDQNLSNVMVLIKPCFIALNGTSLLYHDLEDKVIFNGGGNVMKLKWQFGKKNMQLSVT